MNKIILFFFFITLIPVFTSAQCGGEKPDWANSSYYKELQNSYLETVIAWGGSYDDVRKKARDIIIERRRLAVGDRVSFSADETREIGLTVASKAVSEYWECEDVYTGYFLFQTLKNPSYKYEAVEVTNTYPFSARVFVPGMAQLHKGSKGKAVLFIGGEIALLGGVVAFEGLRSSYQSKINSTHNADDRQSYINKTDNMQNMRNAFIAGAAALYVWNVIDGIVGKGKRHVQIKNASVQVAPFATPDAGGVSLAINF